YVANADGKWEVISDQAGKDPKVVELCDTQQEAKAAAERLIKKDAIQEVLKNGEWKEVARRRGPSLDRQSEFYGRPIRYGADGKAYIKEFRLDGTHFDRFRDGVLGEVKDDYEFAVRIGQYTPDLKAVKELQSEAARHLAIARKYGVALEWY